jgi:hypothetical protein
MSAVSTFPVISLRERRHCGSSTSEKNKAQDRESIVRESIERGSAQHFDREKRVLSTKQEQQCGVLSAV